MPFSRSVALAALVLATSCSAPAPTPAAPPADPVAARSAVDSVLTTLHQTASEGAWDRYFALYAPDAVFIGTDATERWDLAQFKQYAAASTGWTYLKTERNIFVAPDAHTAWFDERLHNNTYGETRGTGVLVKGDSGWKVVQYNLTIPIPNALAEEFAKRIAQTDSAS